MQALPHKPLLALTVPSRDVSTYTCYQGRAPVFLHLLQSVLYTHGTNPADAATFACTQSLSSRHVVAAAHYPMSRLLNMRR